MLIYKKTLVKKSQICFNKYENISTLGKNRRKQAFFVVMQNNVGGKGLMLKRIFLAILLLFTSYVPAHSAEIVNVEYVHSLIKKVWDIDVPYYEDSLKYAANMEYVLKAVDKANEILNGTPTTDYGSSEYATLYAADTVATIDAVNRLIEKQNKSSFYITTTPDTSSFDIMISAAGEYTIDWGDGKTDTITKTDTTMTPYSHTYDKAGEYTIGLGGKATDYNDAEIDITQEGSEELMMMSAAISFAGNTNIANISGSLGEIFSTLPDGSQPRFAATFMMTSITSIPENLFSGVQGAPTDFMFVMTFGMTSITSIPENLFSGIQGEPKSYMFSGTFVGCTSLTGIIPEDLFAGIQGAPANSMFDGTFYGCAGLTGIPENLFAGISGAPAEMMFNTTFSGCSGLTSIPVDLFAGIQGAPASGMFWNTFSDCSGLTSIPAGLFAGIQGTPAENMFALTFDGCSGLTGEIPLGLFGELSGVPAHSMFWDTFNGCEGLTGPSARMPDGTYLYDYFNTATTRHVSDMYRGATGLDDYPCIPKAWGGAGGVCTPKSSFHITTTPDTSSFSFNMSAAGEYTIDWGDGNIETITKTDTTMTPYSHTYDKAGEYTIGLGGKATDYNDAEIDITQEGFQELAMMSAAISFMGNTNIAEISGSLGEIFSTLSDGRQPRFAGSFAMTPITSIPENLFSGIQGAPTDWMFMGTFAMTPITSIPAGLFADIQGAPATSCFAATFEGCSGLTSNIPEDLFAGISGAPAEMMFAATFSGCSGLTGEIPAGLFGELSGAPAVQMFDETFYGCSGLTSIPEDLFAGIQGAPASSMFQHTFSRCSGLTGEIPADLFAGIKGAPADSMFSETFSGCSGLTSIPADLFAGIQGASAIAMFYGTFSGCTNLTGSIPENLFAGITGAPAIDMFAYTFYGCSGLTGPSARQPDGTYLYNYFNTATTSHVGGMYRGVTGLSDYASIPVAWK